MSNYLETGTVLLDTLPSISAYAAAVGKKEGEGPLGSCFDYISDDVTLGENSWEKSESALQKEAFRIALSKGGLSESDISFVFAGDLLNQCTGSAYGLRDTNIPFAGLYGACSTMAESLALAGIFIDNNIGNNAAALTSSHFCSAERTFRFPINYGGVRTSTSQWTATASGCCVVSPHLEPPFIRAVTIGRITDMGIKDANNMGAAMAGAAYRTITAHLSATGAKIDDFDMIATGDLGTVGSKLLSDLFRADGLDISKKHADCGVMLYNINEQDVHAGGSGCGCSASVLTAHLLPQVKSGKIKNLLFAATGALMSPTVVQQGESIPGISHAVHITALSGR